MNSKMIGSYRQFSDKRSDHLGGDDLDVGAEPICVTITDYSFEKVTAPNGHSENKLCLTLQGLPSTCDTKVPGVSKKLPIGPTNGKLITDFLGTNRVEQWVGCNIYIYRTTINAFKNPRMPCIRVAV